MLYLMYVVAYMEDSSDIHLHVAPLPVVRSVNVMKNTSGLHRTGYYIF